MKTLQRKELCAKCRAKARKKDAKYRRELRGLKRAEKLKVEGLLKTSEDN